MKSRYKWLIALLLIVSELSVSHRAKALTDTRKDTTISPLSFSGYIGAYYGQDINKSAAHTRPGFIYSHNTTGEFAVNLAYLRASYQTQNVRANIALAAGSYMNANYAAENGVLKNIYEADAGVKISKKSDLWIDAGILPCHIGFESAVGKTAGHSPEACRPGTPPILRRGKAFLYLPQ